VASKWQQAWFTPTNPQKYIGDVNKIFLRSSWEMTFARFLDRNPNVLEWASEEISIEYFNPIKKRPAKYFPDFYVKYQNKHGEIIKELVEIKPHNQVIKPTKKNKQDMSVWVVNMEKWKNAIQYCKSRHMKFSVLTEKSLYL